jgi:cold shock protein
MGEISTSGAVEAADLDGAEIVLGLHNCHRLGQGFLVPPESPIGAMCGGRPAGRFATEQRRKSTDMATGTVKWFNDAKGFGFITPDDGGEDVFCHHTAIKMDGFRTVAEGQKVQFDVSRGPKGLQASNVSAIG